MISLFFILGALTIFLWNMACVGAAAARTDSIPGRNIAGAILSALALVAMLELSPI